MVDREFKGEIVGEDFVVVIRIDVSGERFFLVLKMKVVFIRLFL